MYDLGGGTFDAAVLRKTDDGFEILGVPEGIEHLGGADFDDAVFDHVRRVLGSTFTDLNPLDPTVRAAAARLRAECVQAKEGLSRDTDTTIPVSLPGIQTEVRLTRQEFEDLIRPSLMGTVESLRRALRSARITPDQVAATVLAGGSSRIPLVAELIGSELRLPVAVGTHPKHAVALGAALIATRDADHPPHDRPTTAMAPIGTATPHLTTEHWDTNRLQTITGGVAAAPEPPTGELTYDQPGNAPRRRRRSRATAIRRPWRSPSSSPPHWCWWSFTRGGKPPQPATGSRHRRVPPHPPPPLALRRVRQGTPPAATFQVRRRPAARSTGCWRR